MSQVLGSDAMAKKPNIFIRFVHDSRSVGILLLACTAISIIVTNIPGIGLAYESFWGMNIPFLESINLPHSPLHRVC